MSRCHAWMCCWWELGCRVLSWELSLYSMIVRRRSFGYGYSQLFDFVSLAQGHIICRQNIKLICTDVILMGWPEPILELKGGQVASRRHAFILLLLPVSACIFSHLGREDLWVGGSILVALEVLNCSVLWLQEGRDMVDISSGEIVK